MTAQVKQGIMPLRSTQAASRPAGPESRQTMNALSHLSALVVLLSCSLASGISPAEAGRQTDAARKHLNQVERQLRDAQDDVARAKRDLEDAQRRQKQLPDQIEQGKKQISSLKNRLAEAGKSLDEARGKIAPAEQAVKQKQEAVAPAQRQVPKVQAQVDAVRIRLWTQIQQKPDYRAAADAQAAAQKRYDQACEACLAELGKVESYAKLAQDLARQERELEELRQSNAPVSRVGAASTQWIETKNEVERRKQAAMERDVAIATTRSELKTATDALEALKAKYEQEMKSHPDLAPLLAELDKAKKAAQAAEANLDKARAELAAASKAIEQSQSQEKSAREKLQQEEQELARKQKSLNSADDDLKDARRRIDNREDDVNRLRRERERAEDTLRDKQRQESRARSSGKKK